jgi:hypothetical protein
VSSLSCLTKIKSGFLKQKRKIGATRMEFDDIKFYQTRGHWEVYVNGSFYCSADTYKEALDEILKYYYLI